MKTILEPVAAELKPEFSQGLVRLGLVTAVLFLLTILVTLEGETAEQGYQRAMRIAATYWVFSAVWVAWLWRSQTPSTLRRCLVLAADLICTSYTMYVADGLGAFFYPVYLWVIAGHGIRYGSRYLIAGMIIAVIGFGVVLAFTPYWQQARLTGAGLLLGLIVLPLYQLMLLRRLQTVNDRLSEELNKTLHAASHDTLTGLANRGYFFQRLDEEITRSKRYDARFAVMFIDLDGFKDINDRLGHQAGDEVLKQTALRLREVCRQSDLAARFGGDEFALIIAGVDECDKVREPARRVAEAVSRPIAWQDQRLQLSASVGVSLYPHDGATPDALTHTADLAMYKVKRQGKRGHVTFACASEPLVC